MTLTPPDKYKLADKKDEYIGLWTRELLHHPAIGPLDLTARQRRVIASLHWWREVAKSNAHMPAWIQQPPPVAGLDSKGRTVVQKLEGNSLRMWALSKEGEPLDFKEPVLSLKTGERVEVPRYAR